MPAEEEEPMPRTVRELAEAYWAAEERRDIDAIMALYHDDAVYRDAGGQVQGAKALRAWYERSAADYPRLHVEILREYPDGDASAIEFDASLWDRDGHRSIIRGVNVFQASADRFTSVRSYEDPPAPADD
jgi:ketosteroid isomerase-like protein